jgi:uncharacterized MAPEG superfamily protein
MTRIVICCVVVLALAPLLAACGASTQGPTTWLDRPLDGATVPVGPVTIQAHASDAGGVAGFEFFVDDDLLVTVPADGARLSQATAAWNPTAPGTYMVRARATDPQGNVGPEATSAVTVGELSPASITPTPSPTYAVPAVSVTRAAPTSTPTRPRSATATRVPPTPTSTPPRPATATFVPPTATRVPPTSTPTTPPPRIVSLQANPSSILAGQCTTVSWTVEGNLTGVWLDGEGVGQYDARDKCPGSTTTFTLVARSAGGEDSESVTVTVTQPQPTATTPFRADLAVTDLRPDTPQGPLYANLTNNGPGTLSNVTIQFSCQWDATESIEGGHTSGQVGPSNLTVISLSPGQTTPWNTGVPIDLRAVQYDITCTIYVPFEDPNGANNSYSELLP